MDSNKNEQYYKMAIAWGENYLKENQSPKSLNYKQGVEITDDLKFVSVNIERIKHNKGAELHSAYARMRDFKLFIEKCKPIVDKII